MEQQNNPYPVMPANVPVKTSKKSVAVVTVVVVVLALSALVGLAYTNVSLKHTNDKIGDLTSKVKELNGLSGRVDQLVNTGANDKILGFDRVDKAGYQSVFLTGGQVYFGKITDITTQKVELEDIYYLRANGQVANPNLTSGNDISLVKLGCELHKPQDKMTIIRSNIIFWENLKDNDEAGVVSAITEYKKSNPNGQKCN